VAISLRGKSVPPKQFIRSGSAQELYHWTQLQPASAAIPPLLNDLPHNIAYDPEWDVYWALGATGTTDYYIISRDPNDPTKYSIATHSDSDISPSADGQSTLEVVKFPGGKKFLIVGTRAAVHDAYSLEITG